MERRIPKKRLPPHTSSMALSVSYCLLPSRTVLTREECQRPPKLSPKFLIHESTFHPAAWVGISTGTYYSPYSPAKFTSATHTLYSLKQPVARSSATLFTPLPPHIYIFEMFFKLALTAVVSALLAAATAIPTPDGGAGVCNTGSLKCCNTVGKSSDPAVTSGLPSLLQVVLSGLDIPIGVNCDPITVIGAGLSSSWYVPRVTP